MAKNIKARDATRDIKTRSPANPHIGVQMKNAARKVKDAAARQVQEPQGSSPNEYAGNAVEEKAKGAAQEAVQTLDSRGRTAAQRTYQRARQKIKEKPAQQAPPADATDAAAGDTHSPGSPSGTGEAASGAPNSQAPAERAAPDRAKAQNRRAQQKKKNTPRQRGAGPADKPTTTAPDSGSGRPTQPKRKVKNAKPKQKPGRTIGRSAKSAKTAQQSARQGQQAAKTAAKSAKAAKQTAQRGAKATEQAVKRGKDVAKATYKAIKAAVEGAKLLVEAIIAGGWVAVVIILIVCLAGFLIASPFGIFFSGGGEQSLPQVVQTLSKEYYDRFDLLQHNYVHDFLNFDGGIMSIDWPQVLAVYAVKVVNDPLDPEEVTTFDKKKTDKLRKILNEMNSFTYSVQNLQTSEGIERTLTIHIATKSAADMARDHHFNADQKAQLDELLSGDYADLWALLLGGYMPGGGEILQGDPAWVGTDILDWPMQAGDYSRISSDFGLRDNPTNPGEIKFHSGIDLAADPGIPILAAADGIVTVANSTDSWGYGWGYYIKIDHGSGFVTLYAHCSQIAVCKDEKVQQGQVIGFIGETGNVTGPHLHFQVWKGGVVANPTNFYTHQ